MRAEELGRHAGNHVKVRCVGDVELEIGDAVAGFTEPTATWPPRRNAGPRPFDPAPRKLLGPSSNQVSPMLRGDDTGRRRRDGQGAQGNHLVLAD